MPKVWLDNYNHGYRQGVYGLPADPNGGEGYREGRQQGLRVCDHDDNGPERIAPVAAFEEH